MYYVYYVYYPTRATNSSKGIFMVKDSRKGFLGGTDGKESACQFRGHKKC